MIKFEDKIREKGYKRLIHVVENILLRPNDNKLMFGEERYKQYIEAVEKVLEDYKEDDLYNYYYGLQKVDHGFCTFGRWKNGLLF